MALNNIVLKQANGIRVFYPITRMFTEPLYNVTRSSNRWEGFRVGNTCLPLCMAKTYDDHLTNKSAQSPRLAGVGSALCCREMPFVVMAEQCVYQVMDKSCYLVILA